MKNENDKCSTKIIKGHKIVQYNNCIYVPPRLQECIIDWYHQYLVHSGTTRMEETIKQIFYWKNMQTQIEEYVRTFHTCQTTKKKHKKYGFLPAKKAETEPWAQVSMDLVKPYTVETSTKLIGHQCVPESFDAFI